VSIEFLMEHMGLPQSDYTRFILTNYLAMLDKGQTADPEYLYNDYLYLSTLSLSSRFPQDHPFQPSLRAADTILATRVFQARRAEKRNDMGELIYAKAKTYLAEVEPAARANDAWAEGFNAGKATGMILEYLGPSPSELDAEGHRLLNDDKAFEEIIADCLLVYKDSLVDQGPYDSGC
jgi:hypothetical protein